MIFAAAVELFEKNEPCDSVTLVELLRSQKKLDKAGGTTYLASLIERVPSSANTAQYARIVQEKYIRRQALKIAQQLVDSVATGNEPIEELIAQTSYELANIEFSGQSNHFKDQRSLIKEGIERIEARAKHPSYVSGVPTPFRKLNQLTNGLQPSDLVILAGRPSMGKSAIAQQIGEYVAEKAGPVVFFTLEMDAESLMDRSFASNAQIPSQKVRSGHLGEADWSRLVATAGKLSSLPILTNDAPSLTAQQIRFLSRQAKARMGDLALVTVDYLGLIRSEETGKQRYLEVGEVTRTLKQLARELKVPVLLLSQLNRSCEARENKRPLLSDLRESGDIEQDADVVMFIYRDEYYCHRCSKGKKSECTKGHESIAEIIVAKQRKGPTGTVSLVWREEFTRFEDRALD
jgi:replicative DNA helicase